jgi:hypothetical protein
MAANLPGIIEPVKFHLFGTLHPDGRALVLQWHKAAQVKKQAPDYESFGRFLELWMAFNNWAMRVTEADFDASMIRSLGESPAMNDAFRRLLHDDLSFKKTVMRFSNFWPIFDVKDLRKKGLRHVFGHLPRPEYITKLREAKVKHKPSGAFDKFAPTWDQTIQTIYIVRCNLIHGEKGDAVDDIGIVFGAFNTLLAFIDGVDLYHWQGPQGVM